MWEVDVTDRTCAEPDCDGVIRARGLCSTHYNARHPSPNRRRAVMATCVQCGVEIRKIADSRRVKRFCSYACRSIFLYGVNHKALVHLPNAIRPEKTRCHAGLIDLTPDRPRVWCSGPCAWCGQQFTIVGQVTARYCSRKCQRSSSKARYGQFVIPDGVRTSIYERDDWICQLCREPVDPDLGPSDPWGATLDHIECRSWALVPDDSPSNLRLAHRWCNSVRGDETYYTTADLACA